MTGITTYLSMVTLNVNGLNSPIKRHHLTNWIKKEDPRLYAIPSPLRPAKCCSTRLPPRRPARPCSTGLPDCCSARPQHHSPTKLPLLRPTGSPLHRPTKNLLQSHRPTGPPSTCHPPQEGSNTTRRWLQACLGDTDKQD
jgi:hypothetical protein